MATSPRVDAHHHVWDLAVRDQPWTAGLPALRHSYGLADLQPHLAEHDIGATVVVQTVNVADETPELLQLAASEPVVAGVVGWVDLTAPDVADRLATLRERPDGAKLVGIRYQVNDRHDPCWLCRDDVRRGLAALAQTGLTYDLMIVPEQLPAAIETAAALPEVHFVLNHAAEPRIGDGEIEPWRMRIRELARHPNVTVKLAGLVTSADHDTWTIADLRPYAEILLETFGPVRMMYGSDWPVCLLAAPYDRVFAAAEQLTAALSESERADVFGATAIRIYGLEQP